jgi:hypothetical protein
VLRYALVAFTLLLLVALAALGATPPRANGEASHVQPTRTAKERLGGKASDEQQVDNCKVRSACAAPNRAHKNAEKAQHGRKALRAVVGQTRMPRSAPVERR